MKRGFPRLTLATSLLVLTLVGPGYATTLSFHATCDNSFHMYLSTDPDVQGAQIGTGNNWLETYNLSDIPLYNVAVQYLQIKGENVTDVAGLVGDFTLSSTDYHFANGTQNLVTNSTDWTVSLDGFNFAAMTPRDCGVKGIGPWYSSGELGEIAADAHWIWASGDSIPQTVYFETPIYATVVPLPPTLLLLGSGLLGLAGWRRFRRG